MFHEIDTVDILINSLVEAIKAGVAENGQVLLLLAGGSATTLYEPLRDTLSPETWEHVCITLTDERYGDIGHSDSNWPAVEDIFAHTPAKRIPILSGESRETEVTDWDAHLHAYTKDASVIALLGIGTDAHTCGIKPFSQASRETKDWVVGYQGDDFDRITTSPAFFPYIDHAFVSLSGPDKRTVYEALQSPGDHVKQPMQNIKICKQFDVFYTIDK